MFQQIRTCTSNFKVTYNALANGLYNMDLRTNTGSLAETVSQLLLRLVAHNHCPNHGLCWCVVLFGNDAPWWESIEKKTSRDFDNSQAVGTVGQTSNSLKRLDLQWRFTSADKIGCLQFFLSCLRFFCGRNCAKLWKEGTGLEAFNIHTEEPLTHAKLKRTHHDCLWPMAAGFSKQQHPPSNEIFSMLKVWGPHLKIIFPKSVV